MSENRTTNLPNVTPFITLLASIDVLAYKCARIMKRSLPEEYRTRRLAIGVTIRDTHTEPNGSVSKLDSDTIWVTGWSLLTEPYFISDTYNFARPAVFITGGAQFEPCVINRDYFTLRTSRPNLFPRQRDLQAVHKELDKMTP